MGDQNTVEQYVEQKEKIMKKVVNAIRKYEEEVVGVYGEEKKKYSPKYKGKVAFDENGNLVILPEN